ncbi:hypothetical protein TNCV_645101 [Trichonephila clavipes]|nr:hypothetical protein TNCV_645101 [Trichonephila clavipes]
MIPELAPLSKFLHYTSGRICLVVNVLESRLAGHEFEPRAAEDPSCRGPLHVKSPDGVVWKLGEGGVSPGVVLVT